MTSSGVYLN